MRFLISVCVPRHVTELLRATDHDVIEAREGGLDQGDVEIMRRAVREQRVIVTADGDFATLALRYGAAHNGIIQLPQGSVAKLQVTLAKVLATHPGTSW